MFKNIFFIVATKKILLIVEEENGIVRSSHKRCSMRKVVLGNFAKFTGKHLCQSLFFNKLWHRCFPVNFAKFLRTPYRTPLVAASE